MKRTKRKTDEPAPAKAPKTAASSSEPLSAAVPNPLKDKALIQAAAIAAARELVAGCATFTGAQFSRRVIEQMGYGREFAVNDQGTRTRLHGKDVKLAAFEAVGAGVDGVGLEGCSSWASEWLKAHEVKQLVTSAHATQEKRAPFAEKLVSLTHLEGLPHSSIRSLMDVAYNNATEPSSPSSAGKRPRFLSASSVYAKLAQLEKRFQQSESTDQVCHSLKGVAKTAGACRLAKEVEAFPANPTTAGIAQMWSLLDATRSKLLATGYLSLPSDPVSPTLPHIAHRWKKNHSSFSA